jgi:hypothetical protein
VYCTISTVGPRHVSQRPKARPYWGACHASQDLAARDQSESQRGNVTFFLFSGAMYITITGKGENLSLIMEKGGRKKKYTTDTLRMSERSVALLYNRGVHLITPSPRHHTCAEVNIL